MPGKDQKYEKWSKRPEKGQKCQNSLSRVLLTVETCLTPHFNRKINVYISVSYIIYISHDRKYPKMPENRHPFSLGPPKLAFFS